MLESGRGSGNEIGQIAEALHDLCQPLTTLQCRLEIAGMTGTAEAYRQAVELGLVECARLMESVGQMHELVRTARQVGVEGQSAVR